jgi:hypothetical protein
VHLAKTGGACASSDMAMPWLRVCVCLKSY